MGRYIRLDPALPNYLRLQWQDQQDEYLHLEQRWFEVMSQLVNFLYQQKFEDAKLSAKIMQLELPNLMAFIRSLNQQLQAQQISAEIVTDKAGSIEQLLTNLNYPLALAEVVSIREQATEQLEEWSHARFDTERLIGSRGFATGVELAQKLLQQCEQAGAEAYTGASYDLAYIYLLFGRILKTGGTAAEALPYLQQAQQHFEALGEQGAGMASALLTEQGDCLCDLGQLEQAVAAYQEAINRDETRGATRDIATGITQLASVRMNQKNYPVALQGYHEALELIKQLNKPRAEATIYHQIGMVYRKQKQFKQADSAYRQSLSIQDNRAGETLSLGELANLYNEWNRPEQAVDYYRQAAAIYTQLGDKRYEGVVRSNLADTLIKLKHLDEARPELLRAIECKQSFGNGLLFAQSLISVGFGL